MRFLVDAHVFDDLSQGSKTYLKGLYSSVLTTDRKDNFYFATNTIEGFEKELEHFENSHHIRYSGHNKFFRLGWEIPLLVKRNKIDWAHFQYISPVQKSCKEIVTIHDVLFLDFPEYFPQDYRLFKNFLFRRSARRAEWVLTVSEYSKRALIKHYGIDEQKIIITPNGILDFFWGPRILKSDVASRNGLEKFILYVSRFEPRKNQVGLLRSYLGLNLWKQGIQLVLVGGKGISTPEFKKCYDGLDARIKKKIFFLEDLSLTDLKWLYENCLLFVYPSFAEGFGIPPLEALACGANIICSNTTAMSEFDFLDTRLFDPRNEKEMTEKIKYFLDHPHDEDMSSVGDYLKTRYSWDTAAKQFLTLFR